MRNSPDRDVAIFTEALRLAASERAAYLDAACGNDGELRRKVEALINAHEQIGNFLEQSPPGISLPLKTVASVGEKPGDRIGHFKLLQQIGEGGCGVVFMAEQEEPLRRRVALKVIKPGMDTKGVIARFEAERQVLALMDHPNVAKIFDAGATESGRPYFVMELVRGIKITEYCDQHSLTTEERLKLFVQVCKAIQHAHQKGIIHRDIKPSNILVTTTTEGTSLPVVIDFGIAKATVNQQLTDKTLFTAFEMLIGTPAYMSPEQAEVTSIDVDTRTDIYSLGVLLYELLTGSTPFDTAALLKAGLDEIRRVIREEEPARPSTRLSKMTGADLTAIAQHRKSEPPTLIRTVRGDLDWIAMKALEKDRTRRYDTANGFAMDLQRYLDNEPVVARPPSAIYRAQKLMLRHKFAFGAGAAIAIMLVLGLTASLWQAARANRESGRALAAERQATTKADAERRAREGAETISKFIIDLMQSPDPNRDGRTITVAETLDRAAKRLETDLANQPDRRATLQETLASTYDALGLERDAIPLREKVRDYHLKTLGPEHTNTLADMETLADSYFNAGRRDEAIKLQEEVLRLRRKINGPEDADTLVAMGALANFYFAASYRVEALKLREEVLTLRRKLKGVSEDPVTQAEMKKVALSYAGPQAEGMSVYDELELREEVLALSRKAKDSAEGLVPMMATNYLAWSNAAIASVSEQLKLRDLLRRLRGNVKAPDRPTTVAGMDHQADSYLAAGRRDEGIKLKEEALALRKKVSGPEHSDTLMAMDSLANIYFAVGRRDESIKLQEEALTIMRKADGPTHPDTLTAMMDLAGAYLVAGRNDQAIKLWEELLKLEREVVDPQHLDPVYRTALQGLAVAYAASGRHDDAFKLRQEALTLDATTHENALARSLRQGPDSPATAAIYGQLGANYNDLGRSEDAIKAWQESVRIDPSGTKGGAAYMLGRALLDRGRYAEALPILRIAQKFFSDGNVGREMAERIALAETMVAGQDPLAPLRQTVAANPADSYNAKRLAIDYLWLGKTNEHEVISRKLLDLAADSSNPTAHDRAAKAYLMLAHPDPETLKRAVASGRQALRLAATNDINRPWYLITAAMAELRDGKPAEADSLLDEALKVAGNNPDRRRMALAYRTLARVHLGRTEEARIDFAELEYLQPALPVPPTLSAILIEPDVLATSLAHEEARALLNLPPRSSKR